MLCYVMLYYIVLYCIVLYYIISYHIFIIVYCLIWSSSLLQAKMMQQAQQDLSGVEIPSIPVMLEEEPAVVKEKKSKKRKKATFNVFYDIIYTSYMICKVL